MRLILVIAFVLSNFNGFSQFEFGIKIGGLAFHQKKVSPNYYKWSIDKKGHWVGYAGFSLTVGYRINPYVGIKVVQSILPYDCAGKFSGITHIGIDLNDRIVGLDHDKHQFSASFGPIFYYRKNWKEVENYYADDNFIKKQSEGAWERKFIWYGGQIQYDYVFEENRSFSTNFLPGYPYIYTFMSGVQVRL